MSPLLLVLLATVVPLLALGLALYAVLAPRRRSILDVSELDDLHPDLRAFAQQEMKQFSAGAATVINGMWLNISEAQRPVVLANVRAGIKRATAAAVMTMAV